MTKHTTTLIGFIVGAASTAAFLYLKKRYNENKPKEITVGELEDILKEHGISVDDPVEGPSYIVEEELTEMRKGTDINSSYALTQFHNMEMSELKPMSKEHTVVKRLYDFEFEPTRGGDRNLYEQLKEHRAGFFGEDSIWADSATWGDLILHYARLMDYHTSEGVGYWVRYILDHLEITPMTEDNDLFIIFDQLVDHSFVNNNTGYFGLFGLDDDAYHTLHIILSKTIDHKTTFQIEFDAFMDMVIQ